MKRCPVCNKPTYGMRHKSCTRKHRKCRSYMTRTHLMEILLGLTALIPAALGCLGAGVLIDAWKWYTVLAGIACTMNSIAWFVVVSLYSAELMR